MKQRRSGKGPNGEASAGSMKHTSNIAYRPDIDGLRAVSILSVVLYHFGVPYMDGGFVGVDVFFVISGYLITSLVLAEVRNGSFSFARFYERRIRRLMPTFAAMLLATFAAGFVIMTPQDFGEFCKSAVYALSVASNLYFADQGGYFSPSQELAPLLHTWSLAVEEQFYIVWPMLLVLLFRFAPRYLLAAAAVFFWASFASNIDILAEKPIAAFYFPHTRIWELLAGCSLALGLPKPRHALVANGAGVAGLALIALAVFGFDNQMAYPGYAAIVPVLGATLVIWSGQSGQSLAADVLKAPPLVFVGLVSYAWYLWHWPLITLFRYQLERKPEAVEIVVLVVVSFALAVLSWHYLEKPVRRGIWWKTRARVFAGGAAASVSLLALVAVGYASDGFIARYPEAMQELTSAKLQTRSKDLICDRPSAAKIAAGNLCPVWTGSRDQPGVLLWGDSHASVLRSAFRDIAETADVSVTYAGNAGCPPIIGAGRKRRRGGSDTCTDLNAAVGNLLRERKFSDVVLVARWNYYAIGMPPENGPSSEQHFLRDEQSIDASLDENKAVLTRGLRRTVDAIVASGARAWIVIEAPYPGFNVPNRLARTMMRGEAVDTMFGRADLAEQKKRSEFMTTLLAELPAHVLDLTGSLCDAAHCLAVANGKPLYFDDNHLSLYGTARLVPLLTEIFSQTREAARAFGPRE